MFNYIIHPKTLQKISIYSNQGKQLLKKMVTLITGGSEHNNISIEELTTRAGLGQRDFYNFLDEARENDPELLRLNRRLDKIMDPYIGENPQQTNNPARLEEMEAIGVEEEYDRVLHQFYTRQRNLDRETENRWRDMMHQRIQRIPRN